MEAHVPKSASFIVRPGARVTCARTGHRLQNDSINGHAYASLLAEKKALALSDNVNPQAILYVGHLARLLGTLYCVVLF